MTTTHSCRHQWILVVVSMRSVLLSLAFLPLLLGATGNRVCDGQEIHSNESVDRPNIILMMADDLGWGDVGFNGNKIIQTPNLNDMAKNGLVLNRFYAAAPVCSPTRGSVLTGRHPRRYGIDFANDGHLPEAEFNLARLLQQQGYHTGHFGKWHLGTLTTTQKDANRGGPANKQHFAPPQLRGFDVCFSTESKVPTYDPLWKPDGAGKTWWNPVEEPENRKPYGTAYWDNDGNSIENGIAGDDSRLIVQHAMKFIESSTAKGQPFLAVVWFHAPHLPVVANTEDREPYREYDPYAQHYFGCVSAMDDAIGQLRRQLKTLDIDESTVIMFCSDNGPEGQARRNPEDIKRAPGTAGLLRGRKRDLFEGGIRVPAVIEWPGTIAPDTTDDAVTTMDYAPTIVELLGLKPQEKHRPFDGESILAIMRGQPLRRSHPIVFESKGKAAVMDGPWKWVRYPNRKNNSDTSDGWLYNLEEDPQETVDLSATESAVADRLRAAYQNFVESSNADRKALGITGKP